MNKQNMTGSNEENTFDLKIKGSYSAEDIDLLSYPQDVIQNKGMYIGPATHPHRMAFEILDNSVDEYLAGYCSEISVSLEEDGFVRIRDNGRGIPVDMHKTGKPAIEVLCTELHSGGKFGKEGSSYGYSGGKHGVGLAVVNALSSSLEVSSFRDGQHHYMSFSNGIIKRPLTILGNSDFIGTEIRVQAGDCFDSKEFSFENLRNRLEELAFLNPGLTLNLTDKRDNRNVKYCYPKGIMEYVHKTHKKEDMVGPVLYIDGFEVDKENKKTMVQCAFYWHKTNKENIVPYTNSILQTDGSHVVGLKDGICDPWLDYAENKVKKAKFKILREDVREGLQAILSIKIMGHSFLSQDKAKMESLRAKQAVEKVLSKYLTSWLDHNPNEALIIYEKIKNNAITRMKMQEVKDISKISSKISSEVLAKLTDCQRDNDFLKEVFLLEGDSASGTIKDARDPRFQAVYAFKGKILNVIKADKKKIMESKEIRDMMAVLGIKIKSAKDDEKVSELRYDRIIILADPDEDGKHIKCLLLAFFYEIAPQVILEGKLFISQPPLYKVRQGNKTMFIKNNKEWIDFLKIQFEKSYCCKNKENIMDIGDYMYSATSFLEDIKKKTDYHNYQIISHICGISSLEDLNDTTSFLAKIKHYENYELSLNWKHDNILEMVCVSSKEKKVYSIGLDSLQYFLEKYGKRCLFPIIIEKIDKKLNLVTINNFFQLNDFIETVLKKDMEVIRNKGIGEIDAEDAQPHITNQTTRSIVQVVINEPEKAQEMMQITMGKEVEPRKAYIEKYAINIDEIVL